MGRVVNDRYFARRLIVPAGTPRAFPLQIEVDVDDLILVAADLRIPDGPCGLTGFAIDFAGHRIVPWGDDDVWIQGNNDELSFSINFEVGTSITFSVYNEGAYDHAFYVRLQFRYLPPVVESAAPALAIVA